LPVAVEHVANLESRVDDLAGTQPLGEVVLRCASVVGRAPAPSSRRFNAATRLAKRPIHDPMKVERRLWGALALPESFNNDGVGGFLERSRMSSPDGSPLLAFVVGACAALPAFALTHRTGRGRARSAIAYLSGFVLGLTAAVLLFQALQTLAWDLTYGSAALAGAFFGPFVGLAWGVWVRSGRRRKKRGA
jgi:hypothetical protein